MWSWCVRASFVRVTHLLGLRRPRLATTATTRLRISSASSRSSNNAVSVTPRTRAPLCLMRAARDSTLLPCLFCACCVNTDSSNVMMGINTYPAPAGV